MALEQENKQKILSIQNKYDSDYEKFKETLKNKYNGINNTEKINFEIEQIKNKNDLLLKEYKNNLKEKSEIAKKEIKREFEDNYKKEIETYTINITQQYKNEINKINNNINNIEKEFNIELNFIKKEINIEENKIKNDLDNIINNNGLIDKINNEQNKEINKFINNKNKEIIKEYSFKLLKTKSLYDETEKQFKNKNFDIKFYIDLILLFTKTIKENNSINNNNNNNNNKIKDNLLLDKLIINTKNLINNYSIKYKNEIINKKLYSFLEDDYNQINNNQQEINENKIIIKKFNSKNTIKLKNNRYDLNTNFNSFSNIKNIKKERYYSAQKPKKLKMKNYFINTNPKINNLILLSGIKPYNLNINRFSFTNSKNKDSINRNIYYNLNKSIPKNNNNIIILNNKYIFNSKKYNNNYINNLPKLNKSSNMNKVNNGLDYLKKYKVTMDKIFDRKNKNKENNKIKNLIIKDNINKIIQKNFAKSNKKN